jgi:hypothetical protein
MESMPNKFNFILGNLKIIHKKYIMLKNITYLNNSNIENSKIDINMIMGL